MPHTQYMEARMIYDISISSLRLQPDAFSHERTQDVPLTPATVARLKVHLLPRRQV